MRIGYLTSEYPALSHTFVRREIAELRRLGLEIAAFSVRPAKISWDEEPVPAILGRSKLAVIGLALKASLTRPIRTLSTFALSQGHREAGLKGWVWSLFHCAEALALTTMLHRAGISRLHSHFANSGATIGLLAAHYLQIPWSFTLHGISETDPPAGAMLPDKLERADFVACASWFMRAQAMRITPTSIWDKYKIVRCGVSLPPAPQYRDADRPVRRFITVGRVSAEKGYPLLMQALQVLIGEGADIELTIVGDGPLSTWLSEEIDRLGLGGRVSMLGGLPEDQTLAQVAQADAFVLPSLMEGLPVVLMEAMAAGKPVIAPTVAGIPELVDNGRTGLLFRPGDWEHLTDQMRYLIGNPQRARQMAEAGRGRVEEEFAIAHAAAPLIALFKR